MKIKYNFHTRFNIASFFSIFLITGSILFIILKGLNLGIDFKGGTLIELRVESKLVNTSDVRSSFQNMDLGDINVKKFGTKNDYLVKFEKKTFDENQTIKIIKNTIKNKLGTDINFRRVENVGPKVSKELLESGILAIILSLGAMLFYIWIRFEWQFSIGSIIAIFHDVFITIGIFSLLSLEVNLSIVAAVLTIVGYSLNDTVVIYDRIRENLRKYSKNKILEILNISINETLSRTIITSGTTLLALLSIFILGGEILRGFAFAMIIGVIIGTYSSIFVASPILKFFNVSFKTIDKDNN